MIKYTPCTKVLKELRKIRKNPCNTTGEWAYISTLTPDYPGRIALYKYYDGFVYFSPQPLEYVPLGGILLPLDLFNSERIS